MKKYIFTALAVALLGFSACSDDTMDDINTDNAHPAGDKVAARLQLAGAILGTGNDVISGDYAFYVGSITEQEFGTGNNQLMKAELRQSVELSSSATFNNSWASAYSNLKNLSEMKNKIVNNIASSGNQFDLLGAVDVLLALNWGVLTDMHGDIPYSTALDIDNVKQPTIDSQKDVYAGILNLLNEAIDNLKEGKSLSNMGDQDLCYQGDVSKWLAAAYALKARYLIHESFVNTSAIAEAKVAAQTAADMEFDGMTISEYNGVTCDNPWSAFVWSRGYTACSRTVTDLMEATHDPRLYHYTYGEDPDDVAAYPGDEDMAKESWTWCYPDWMDLGSQPVHMMSKSELYFILAEAQLRCGEDGTAAFQTAVAASVNEIADWTGDEQVGDIFAASLGDATLQKVFEQKYLSQVADEQLECYTDLRRCMAMGEEYIHMTNPKNTQGGFNRWPYLLPYGSSSVTTNPNVEQAYGDGTYIYSTKSWLFTK